MTHHPTISNLRDLHRELNTGDNNRVLEFMAALREWRLTRAFCKCGCGRHLERWMLKRFRPQLFYNSQHANQHLAKSRRKRKLAAVASCLMLVATLLPAQTSNQLAAARANVVALTTNTNLQWLNLTWDLPAGHTTNYVSVITGFSTLQAAGGHEVFAGLLCTNCTVPETNTMEFFKASSRLN